MFNDHRRPESAVGRPCRAASSAAVVVLLALIPLAACSSDSEPSTAPDSGATTPAGSGGSEQNEAATHYYPAIEGATLTYQISTGLGDFTTEVTVNAVTSGADGQTIAATEVSTGDESATAERRIRIAPDGSLHLGIDAGLFFALGPATGVTYEGDDIVIPSLADLAAGRTSSGTFVEVTDGERLDVAYTVRGVGREEVTVPAGRAEAYVVEMAFEVAESSGTTSYTGRYWLAPGFGLVRQEFESGLGTVTAELVSSSVPLP